MHGPAPERIGTDGTGWPVSTVEVVAPQAVAEDTCAASPNAGGMPGEPSEIASDDDGEGLGSGQFVAIFQPWLRAVGTPRLGVDVRGLAAMRIAVGLLVLADLAIRSRDLVAHYGDAGVLPRTVLREAYPGLSGFAWAHGLSGTPWLQGLLFLVAGMAGLALVIGYRPRLMAALSFLLLVSLQARNPALLNAGDSLLRRLLLWGSLLPIGARWSVEAVRRDVPASIPVGPIVSIASVGLLVQVVVVYVVNAVLKLRGDAWLSGEAVRIVFGLDHLTVGLGDVLAGHPALLEGLGLVWLGLLVASPLLLVLSGWPRAAVAVALAVGHLGMLLTLRLGLFPLVSMAALLPFLPPRFWDGVAARCASWSPLPVAVNRLDARLLRRLQLPSPERVRRAGRTVVRVAAAVLLVFVLVWNAMGLGYVDTPDGVRTVADPTERRWDMFAPDPRDNDGWFVAPAMTVDGRTVDAWNGGAASFDRPAELARTFPSHRWFVYMLALPRPDSGPLREAFAGYLCRRWNARHASSLERVTVYFVEERVRPDAPESHVRVDLGTFACPPG